MNVKVISIPARINDNFGSGFSALFSVMEQIRLLQDNEPVELDMTKCVFLNPLFLLPLMLVIKDYGKHREIRIRNDGANPSFLQYSDLISFNNNGLQPENIVDGNYESTLNQYAHKTYIPIVNFPVSRTGNATDIRDKFINVLNNLLVKQLVLKGGFHTGIMYLLNEAINNIVDHSNEERGFVFAQYFPSKAYIDICVADTGIGILRTYQNKGIIEITSDKAAIGHAATGISTKDSPENESRGYGISTSKKMLAQGLKGKYFLLSGNAFLIKDAENEQIVEIPDIFSWKGTLVALRIPYAGNLEFNPSDYYEN